MTLARYTPNGNLDAAFGKRGIVSTSAASVAAAALQADGEIVTVGSQLARFNSNGSLDTTFGSRGLASLPANFHMDSLLIQPSNGDIVLGGYYHVFNGTQNGGYALLRYNPNGTLDSTFGMGGEVVATTGPLFGNGIQSVALENGDIVAGGLNLSYSTQFGNQWSFDLARFTLNGSLDPTFGSGGIVATPTFPQNNIFNNGPSGLHLLAQPNGQIVAVGTGTQTSTSPADWTLARYNIDGSLDNTFGSSGLVTTNITANGDYAVAATLQSNGQIVVVGEGGPLVGPNWDPDGALLEVGVYNSNGTPDTSFGSGGFVTQAYATGAGARGVVIQPNGKIVVAGTANFNGSATSAGTDEFMVARYLPSAAQIALFTASPNPVTAGSNETLTASNITLADPSSTITQVAFSYLDGSGNLQLLGYGTQSTTGTWTLTLTVNLASGNYTLYAQATDSDGVLGDPVALTLTVQ